MTSNQLQWDEYGTRYQLVQENPGFYNWLFVPGGAGADSSYFLPLLKVLQLPGKVWLIDFPGNGSNTGTVTQSVDFEKWSDCLLACVKKFENPVYVGHSFGGMFVLLFPELENLLKGLIIIGATPITDRRENEKMMQERNIVIDMASSKKFKENQNDETFKDALIANAACHFPAVSLAEGRAFFRALPFNFQAILWWNQKVATYNAQWIPLKVPTLILGGSEDCVNPSVLFERDLRFKRDNIALKIIQGSGHFPWFENLEIVKTAIAAYVLENLSQS